MKIIAILVLCALVTQNASADQCPSGGDIYEWGISEQGKNDIIAAHNNYRQMILDGTVPNQPRGKNIKMVSFDDNLANEGRKVSETCVMNHVLASDDRWGWIGQNLYIAWSSDPSDGQDWAAAAESWFSEYKDFIYPNQSNGVTGHYTQLIWANSEFIGCDFISFYDNSQPSYPYAKLYTCNYGPGGNYEGEAPYELA